MPSHSTTKNLGQFLGELDGRADGESEELMIGQKIAHYRITAAIGAGGMGQVYRATDTKLGRDVALKVLPPEMASSHERLERFQREARAVAALNHPHVVTIYSVEEADGIHFLTMELVDGEPLDRLIPAGGMAVSRMLEIAGGLADALCAAHEKGIVHRDLKPANVMVTKAESVKVLDFGLARITAPAEATLTLAEDQRTQMQTREGVVMGTMPYMSPEQLHGQALDHRTDIFSLGIMLYEMACGERPFRGDSSVALASAILRDTPRPLPDRRKNLPEGLVRIISRCLEKSAADRFPSARDLRSALGALIDGSPQRPRRDETVTKTVGRVQSDTNSRQAGADEGFGVALMPFKFSGARSELEDLAAGLTEEIITGFSRFTYLRVRSAGNEPGARYMMEGSLRQAGTKVRLAVQFVDTESGARIWAETYERPFDPDATFELQDDLVHRIVGTCADRFGVLARSISDAVRGRDPDQLGPYEALMRGFGYHHRLTETEHAAAREVLERAVDRAPTNADCWAMLSWVISQEYGHEFNPRSDSLDRALAAARRAVDIAPSSPLAQQALAVVSFFRKEKAACVSAAERAMALNPLDTSSEAMFLIAFSGDWDRGCTLIRGAMELNPHHPRWYELTLSINEYRLGNYRAAVDEVARANAREIFWSSLMLAAAHAQLGEHAAARNALRELLARKVDYAQSAGESLSKWFDPQMVAHLIEGLRKAGLEVVRDAGEPSPAPELQTPSAQVSIAVLPFSDMSAAKDQEYLCEGMAEEIMNALVRIDGIRVASRTSAFRAGKSGGDLASISSALSVNHVLEGSVRTAGARLRVTAQLTDAASGYQLWSERFDREAIDVFAIQDEIAAGVVEAVKNRLTPGTRTVHPRPHVHDLDAYRSYLKGRHLRGKEDFFGAMSAFEEAVRLDPAHAPSWTGLAEITVLSAHMGMIAPRDACTAARKMLATANELQGESAEGLHVEAFIAGIERRWDAMETTWRRALELQPDHVLALGSFAITLCARQRLEEALPLFERARQADPLASFPYTLAGWGLLMSGRLEDALRQIEDALSFEKEDASAIGALCIADVALGRFAPGIDAGERGVAVTRRAPFFLGILGWALAQAGRDSEARTVLEELRARPAGSPTAVSEAWLLGVLGEIDDAFTVLARAEDEYQGLLSYTGLPGFDSVRGDPRFAALLERLHLSPA